MSDFEKYVEQAAVPLDPDAFDKRDPQHDHWALDIRRGIARDRVRRILAAVGPLIAEDARERIVAAAGVALEREAPLGEANWEATVRRLVEAELRHYGYTDEQVALAHKIPPHTSDCTFEAMDWDCSDENGKSFHPESDEADQVAGVIVRALEALEVTS